VLRAGAAIAAATALLVGCGAPERLDRHDSLVVTQARERLDDAVDTEETLRTSPAEARRLRAEVRRALAKGDRAALAQAAPSLVSHGRIDRGSAAAFLAHPGDSKAALRRPAEREVDTIVDGLDDADGHTKLPTAGDQTAGSFTDETAAELKPIWPDLAKRLRDAV
jgi:hypothetical protein